ncbi:hypothetical protein EVAR_57382_1 [Eumeta japonica]|uniref:Uncharacterized protein n=1 Tax=Eumeta variegata TaxID=151549 RepID=A0A4C1ZBV9_EUMVA|nr:hypothetical protein EVAR_57382_1 [Eumeta japonica]
MSCVHAIIDDGDENKTCITIDVYVSQRHNTETSSAVRRPRRPRPPTTATQYPLNIFLTREISVYASNPPPATRHGRAQPHPTRGLRYSRYTRGRAGAETDRFERTPDVRVAEVGIDFFDGHSRNTVTRLTPSPPCGTRAAHAFENSTIRGTGPCPGGDGTLRPVSAPRRARRRRTASRDNCLRRGRSEERAVPPHLYKRCAGSSPAGSPALPTARYFGDAMIKITLNSETMQRGTMFGRHGEKMGRNTKTPERTPAPPAPAPAPRTPLRSWHFGNSRSDCFGILRNSKDGARHSKGVASTDIETDEVRGTAAAAPAILDTQIAH